MKRYFAAAKNNLVFFVALAALAMLFVMHSTVKQRVSDALSLCCGTLIPSLFPALAVTSFLARSGIPDPIRKIAFFPLHLLTGAPYAAAPCFLLGQTAGYPAGVKAASALYRQGLLSRQQAANAALVNVNPGLPFSILIVGKSFAGNTLTGVSIYASAVLADLLLSLFFRRSFLKDNNTNFSDTVPENTATLLIRAVKDACEGTIHICAWITAFSVFSAPIERFPFLSPAAVLLETTNGAAACVSAGNYPLCAFSMSFGGFCLLFQLLPDLKAMGIPAYRYLAFRSLGGIFAFTVQVLLQHMFPSVVPAVHLQKPVFHVTAGSYLSAAALLLTCAVFMLNLISERPAYGKKKP